jgi:glutamate racemase
MAAPIGVFDSGYGGLTILKQIRRMMPEYDYLYLGDNARAPYGPRSYEVVYEFTLQAVHHLFDAGCPLVILACNTASAKALRSIQQRDLPFMDDPTRRVLGVIRPTVESVGDVTKTRHVGLFATPGTVRSLTYEIEIHKLFPDIKVTGVACPMWVPLVENEEFASPGADYFVRKYVDELLGLDPEIDTIILGCTHYPLLLDKIRACCPERVTLMSQGDYVANSLQDYLQRHPEMQSRLSRGSSLSMETTEQPDQFSSLASLFLGESAGVDVKRITL